MGFKFARATWGLLVLLGIGQILLAQENDKIAIIAIRVTDVSGAAVEGAEVRFVEQARRVYEVKRTDKTGQALAELKPGKYEVKVTASRFKSVVIHYVEAAAAKHKEFEVSLEALPPVPDIVDPVGPLIEPKHIEPRDTEIRERFSLAQDSRQSIATAPVYLPSGETDASVVSVILAYLRKPSLLDAAKDATARSFRVTYFSPVPTHEVAVRLVVNADGSGQIASAVSTGAKTGVSRTTNSVSKADVDRLLDLVDEAGFWARLNMEPLPESQPDETGRKPYVLDGAWWMLEVVQSGSFHYVFRRNPTPTPITEIGCYLAKNLVKANSSEVPMPGCVKTIQTDHPNTGRFGGC